MNSTIIVLRNSSYSIVSSINMNDFNVANNNAWAFSVARLNLHHVRKRRLRITAPSRYDPWPQAWASLLEYLDENRRTKSIQPRRVEPLFQKCFAFEGGPCVSPSPTSKHQRVNITIINIDLGALKRKQHRDLLHFALYWCWCCCCWWRGAT